MSHISSLSLKNFPQPADTIKKNTALEQTRVDNKMNSKLKKACIDFEALILKQMLTQMRNTITKSDLLDNSYAHEMFQSMQDEQLADKLAQSGGIGLAQMMYLQAAGTIKTSTGR